jgi:hypothetical protein
MPCMDPLAFLLANNATRTAILGAEPWNRPRRRHLRRPERIR